MKHLLFTLLLCSFGLKADTITIDPSLLVDSEELKTIDVPQKQALEPKLPIIYDNVQTSERYRYNRNIKIKPRVKRKRK